MSGPKVASPAHCESPRRALVLGALVLSAIALSVAPSGPCSAGVFKSRTDLAVWPYPSSVALGDLNKDGVLDLAVSCRGNGYTVGQVSVLLGVGDGTFGPRTDFSTFSDLTCLAIGDLNRDGNPDLMTAHGYSRVASSSRSQVLNPHDWTASVLLGGGDGTFGSLAWFGQDEYPATACAIGDLNGDLKPDMVATNSGADAVTVFLGAAIWPEWYGTNFPVGSNPSSVAIGDLNGDVKPDLVVANQYSASVSVLLGNGNGTFGAKTDFGTAAAPLSVAIGDLNADGKPDLVVAAGTGVSVLLGNGDGSFGAKTNYATGTWPWSVALGDLNADGKPDLAVANFGFDIYSDTVSVLLGNGDGTFGSREDYVTANKPVSLAIGDLNRDGRPDLVVACWGDLETVSPPSVVSVLLGGSVTDVEPSATPRAFQVLAPRPNPSRGTSQIRFALSTACAVDVDLFDLAGRRVRSLVAGERFAPGERSLRWDGRDDSGAPVRDGVYLVHVRGGREVGASKLVILQ